jgi:hypothetical protein
MREIKFRAWDNKKFYYFSLKDALCKVFNLTYLKYNKCIIQQDTGFKDKNGKEIYKGDVLSNGDVDNLWVVSLFKEKGYYNLCQANGDLCEDRPMNPYNLKVIGNIYENPELLTSSPN